MILDVLVGALVVVGALIYKELRDVAKVSRAHYKIQGLSRFK